MAPKMAANSAAIVALLTLLQGVTCNKDVTLAEFCNDSVMELSCGQDDHVLLVSSARYGRVKVGECVKRDLGYVGCAVDVLRQIDGWCSGRATCSVNVMHTSLRALQPCPSDVTWHLEVGYRCVHVETAPISTCHSNHVALVSNSGGFLSSSTATQTGVGTASCPWQIQAQAGQRINITAFNFITSAIDDPSKATGKLENPEVCYQFATVTEGFSKRTLTVCSGEPRQKVMYMSTTSNVKVEFLTRQAQQHAVTFMLQYRVQGCADLAPKSRYMWMKRTGDDLRVRCNRTGETWYLTCDGERWLGQLGNCSDNAQYAATGAEHNWQLHGMFGGSSDFPVGILIIVSVGVALGVFLGGTLLILVALHMKRKRRAKAARAACLDPGYLSSDTLEIKATSQRTVPLYDESDNYNMPKDYFKVHSDTLDSKQTLDFSTTDQSTASSNVGPPPYGRPGIHMYESAKVTL